MICADTKYYYGSACKRGHAGKRYVSTGACADCAVSQAGRWQKDNSARANEKNRRWQKAHPEVGYAYHARWSRENPGKMRAASRKYYARNSVRRNAENKQYRAQNPEKERVRKARWIANNPEKTRAMAAARRAAKSFRTPVWADLKAIELVYAEAARLTTTTGILHEVDHVIPLRGAKVSGLHVHGNLQILTESENMAKGNRFYIESESVL
jgi:hypothetical protein